MAGAETTPLSAGFAAPGRGLPLAYLGLGHLCLAAAFGAVARWPASFAGFYYHPRMLAVVHLVTLGWITAAILGALYMVVPTALGGRLPIGRADRWLFAGYLLGATGMASHFWIVRPVGMAWSAGLAAATALSVTARAARALARASLPAPVRSGFYLAFANLALAAGLGVAVAVDKLVEVLPGGSLDHVLAHAHLAALGWATMVVIAAASRLLPMMLPVAPPGAPWIWAAVVTTEVGVLGLALSLYLGAGPLGLWAAITVTGLGLFGSRVVWMLRHRRPPSPTLPRPELGKLQVAAALGWLVVAAAVGLAVALVPAASWRPQAILVYGAAGLVGFLSQIVVGVANRIVPLWLGLGELGGRPHAERPPSPYALADRRLQLAVLALWTAGVPLLAAGLGLAHHPAVRAGATLLTLAAATGLLQLTLTWRTARTTAR